MLGLKRVEKERLKSFKRQTNKEQLKELMKLREEIMKERV